MKDPESDQRKQKTCFLNSFGNVVGTLRHVVGSRGASDVDGQRWEDNLGEARGDSAGKHPITGRPGSEGRRETSAGRERHGSLRGVSADHCTQSQWQVGTRIVIIIIIIIIRNLYSAIMPLDGYRGYREYTLYTERNVINIQGYYFSGNSGNRELGNSAKVGGKAQSRRKVGEFV